MAARWRVEVHRGSAAELHARPLPDPVVREVWVLEVSRPALVLGSAQREDSVDARAATEQGIGIARRRSGGGAVLLEPGAALWIDALLPAADGLWDDDVGRAFAWFGSAWAAAFADLDVKAEVHTGRLQRSAWSDLVCFAGLGPGEVTVGGSKVVGISQRRTRAGARFQAVALARWDPARLLGLLALADGQRAEGLAALGGAARGVEADLGLSLAALRDAVVAQLPG